MKIDFPHLDIIIPVYNEGESILPVLSNLKAQIKTPFRIFICYDFEEDSTIKSIKERGVLDIDLNFVKNSGKGVHGAILTGFAKSTAPFAMVYPADDEDNAKIVDRMMEKALQGNEIVVASRFIEGGCMVNCRWTKALIVRSVAWSLYHIVRLPVHDATNGFRLFTRKVLKSIPIESKEGFTYSLELLVKAHRLGWPVEEVPSQWFERKKGKSRFKILRWSLPYIRWYLYAVQTTFLRAKSQPLVEVNASTL